MAKINVENTGKLVFGIILVLVLAGKLIEGTQGGTTFDAESFTIEDAALFPLLIIFFGIAMLIYKNATSQTFTKRQMSQLIVAVVAVYVLMRWVAPELGVLAIAPLQGLESVAPFIFP